LPDQPPRTLPSETCKLVKDVQYGLISTDTDDFEENFQNQFKENDKYLKEEVKIDSVEEGKESYVAIKKSKWRRMDYLKHSFNFSTFKEISFLQELEHPNIVKIRDIFFKDISIYVVLEYMVGDLHQLVHKDKASLSPSHVKYIMKEILTGLQFMHDKNIMHRDLKPGNLLISDKGEIRYADFGIARYYEREMLHDKETDSAQLTRNVCTRYYKPPEILYGANEYDFSVDIWGVGCIMAEITLGRHLFQGENELDQLNKIFSTLGNAVEDNWPGVSELPNYIEYDCEIQEDLDTLFSSQTEDFIDLIKNMIILDPSKRFTVKDALEHKYFTSEPPA